MTDTRGHTGDHGDRASTNAANARAADALVSMRGFSKSYAGRLAVDGLDLIVRRGELFGLIGPDGAGKTTTLRTIVTLLRPDAGEITVCGHPVHDTASIRAICGYMPQRFSLYPDLSIDQNLTFFADLFGVPTETLAQRKRRLYEFSRLEAFAHRQAGRLSGGMKQKLALSCTLIHDPAVLVLDEPTTGVDPVSRVEFWTILRELTGHGVGILVSTPYMDEALLCDRILILHEGRALATGKPRELIAAFEGRVYAVVEADLVMRAAELPAHGGVRGVHSFGDALHVTTDPEVDADALRIRCRQAFGRDVVLEEIAPSLEDLFIDLIARSRHAA